MWPWLASLVLLSSCAPGQSGQPEAWSRAVSLGDGTLIRHPWDESGPLPAVNDWVAVEVAGYFLSENKEGPGFEWTWTFTLALRHADIDLVAVSDVTDANATRLVAAGEGVFNENKWLAQSEAAPVSAFHQPWLFRNGESVRVLRFSIADSAGETRIVYQPVLFTHETKRRLTAIAGPAGTGMPGS